MSNWRRSTWGEEISLEYGKALRSYSETGGSVQVFGTNGPIGWTDTALTDGPGVILGRKGAYRGVHYSHDPFFVIDTAYYVRPKTDLDMRWLYYAIIYHQLGQIDDGSPIPSTTRAAVYPRELEVPQINEQRAIAAVLGALDDKIEHNRKTARALEHVARTIFRAWFVDFEPVKAKAQGRTSFPSMPQTIFDALPAHFVDTAIGPIPEGWEVSNIGSCSSYLSRGITPKYIPEGGVLVVNQKCIRDSKIDYAKARRHDSESRKVDGRELAIGDVLINSTGVGTLGRVAQVLELPEPAIVDSHVTVVRPITRVGWAFLGQALNLYQSELEGMGEGSTGQTELSRKKVADLRLVLPPEPILKAFDACVIPLLQLISRSSDESQKLASVRDYLLPKLLSGKVSVTVKVNTPEVSS